MTEILHPAPGSVEVPLYGSADLIRENLAEHRTELAEHNPAALNVAARALSLMHEISSRRVNEIRADRSRRYRSLQLMGERSLPLEDLVAIALEGEAGREIALQGLRLLAEAVGCDLVRRDNGADTAAALLDAAGSLAREQGELVAEITQAESDGKVSFVESERIQRRARAVSEKAQLAARVAARRALHEQKKAGK